MSDTITALNQARSTGQPVPIPGGSGLVAYPNGSVGTPGGGFGGARAATLPQAVVVKPPTPTAVQPVAQVDDYGRAIPTINVYPQPQQRQAPLNQANPNTTYVSPNTPQPTGAPPVGQTDTQSGQPVHATYNMPPAPDTATAARTYRLQHGLSTSDDTDALNAESLAAAQAGRTSFNPTLAAQYGQPPAAGVSGPRTDVVNALSLPASATQQQPTQVAQNLLQQGVY